MELAYVNMFRYTWYVMYANNIAEVLINKLINLKISFMCSSNLEVTFLKYDLSTS